MLQDENAVSHAQPVPYDENLLERSRTQWQFGDWESLVKLERDALQHHPDRAKLALLAAAGHAQKGNLDQARSFTRLAKDWGCGKQLISQVLIAGVHNSLGRAAALGGQQPRAQMHFESAIQTGTPGGDSRLLTQARIRQQLDQLGLELTANNQLRLSPQYLKLVSDDSVDTQLIEESCKKTADKTEYLNKTGGKNNKEGKFDTGIDNIFPNAEVAFARKSTPDASPLSTQNHKIENKKNPQSITSVDAEIDDMINDLQPFFEGKFITYVDIGACIGDVFKKIYNSKAFKIREAHLYEPNPINYKELIANIKNYNISSLHAYNFAIGSQESEKNFTAAGPMTKSIDLSFYTDKYTNTFSVKSYSLDTLSEAYTDSHINILKIDVEGAEIDVLKGANKLLSKQNVDVIYIEVGFNTHGTQQTFFGKIDNFLQNYNYRVFKIYEQKNEWLQDSPLLRRCNFAYMSRQFADANPLKKTQEIAKLNKEIAKLKSKLKNDAK
ncbi:hypothetical protein JCM31598_25080 [Desulfonatronum parangueonense]